MPKPKSTRVLDTTRAEDGVYEPVQQAPGPLAVVGEAARLPTKPRQQATALLEAALRTGVRGELRDAIQRALDAATAGPRRSPTDLQYLALRPGEELVDRDRPGFLARANRRGVRLVYRHRDPETSRQAEHLIGFLLDADRGTGDISLADARAAWERLRAQRLEGRAPVIETAAPVAALPTLSRLAELYLKDYAEKVKRPRSAAGDARLLHRHLLPKYGHLTADQFTTDLASQLLVSLAHTPREALSLRAVLSTLFNVAAGRTKKTTVAAPWLPRDFANPITNAIVAEHKPTVHEPSKKEIKAYARALRTNRVKLRQDVRDALLLQLLCASRIAEVVEMQWSEVDLEHGEWTLPAARSKNHDKHVVVLSAPALEILKRRATTDAVYVFPSPASAERPLRVDIVQHALAQHREKLGVSAEFTSHNVRHAFTTWAADAGAPVEVVNRCTAHRIATGINARYNFAKLTKPAAALWAAWAEWLS